MAKTNGEPKSQALDPDSTLLPPSKRKCDSESPADGDAEREKKHQKPDIVSDSLPDTANNEGGQDAAADKNPDLNGENVKEKAAVKAVDKGKGILVEEEEEEEGEEGDEDDDSDDSSDAGSGEEIVGEGDDDSDFVDDPLAEVDLDNILPARTRRRDPLPPGAFYDPYQEEDDSEDSE